MASGTLVSRCLGLTRVVLLASVIGLVSPVASAFATANTVPNSLYLLLAGGVLNSAIVPAVVRLSAEAGGDVALNRLMTICITAAAGLSVLVVAAAPLVPRLFAASFGPDLADLTVAFAYWCLPQFYFYCVFAVVGQVLNARGVYGPFTWAPVVNNAVAIIGLLLVLVTRTGDSGVASWTASDVALLGGTSTLGVALQALVLLPFLRRAGIRPRWRLKRTDLPLDVGHVMGWALGSALINQLGFVVISNVTNASAERRGGGRNLWDNAFLLLMLPHSLVTVSLATALFTRFSAAATQGDAVAMSQQLDRGVRLIASMLTPCAVLLAVFAADVTRTLYPGSSVADTQALAAVVRVMSLALLPLSLQHLLQRVMYAHRAAKAACFVQLLIVSITASWSLGLGTVVPARRLVQVAASGQALGLTVGVIASALVVRSHVPSMASILVQSLARSTVPAIAAGAFAGVLRFALLPPATSSWHEAATGLLVGGSSLIVVYVLLGLANGAIDRGDVRRLIDRASR
ncbi:MAG TPA: lipid II flippase MurJ [Marmoricola sp.]|nr:lipid II flippase MurJ [Marmoricola sp.]